MPAPDLSKPKPKARSSVAKGKKDASGLGRALINRRAKEHKRLYEEALHTTELPSGLHSVTQENDLDEFLNTAQLAATDFSAERNGSIKVLPTVSVVQQNPYLLSAAEERDVKAKHASNRKRLRVPRRPAWTRDMPKEELERKERDEFLEWRKGLAEMEDNEALLLTPFERNLSVWRQLWRTLERSHLIVQIVDARNPLGFRCEDLETYVKEVGTGNDNELKAGAGKRKSLVLVNKADLLTEDQRKQWADYFEAAGVAFAFFSAKAATDLQEQEAMLEDQLLQQAIAMQEAGQASESDEDDEDDDEAESEDKEAGTSANGSVHEETADAEGASSDDELAQGAEQGLNVGDSPFDRTQVLSVEELEELFVTSAPDLNDFILPDQTEPPKLCVGLVGYPNVGKSSTINALVGQKKVSVSSTPGKTKNFQTIHLSPEIVLCDCPGLVFPQFATTKAGMVCDGVLPIDQMREHTAPVELVTRRIPKKVLEGIYGIRISTLPISEGGTGVPTASELLSPYAIARGFATSGQGNPDESRASRYILKDYVNAKLLYAHPPPGVDADKFNEESRDLIKLALTSKFKSKRAPTTRVGKKADTFVPLPEDDGSDEEEYEGQEGTEYLEDGTASISASAMTQTFNKQRQSAHAHAIERDFFGNTAALSSRAFISGGRTMAYPGQRQLANDGTKLTSRQRQELSSLGAGAGVGGGPGPAGKKHFKANKRQKQRSGGGYEY